MLFDIERRINGEAAERRLAKGKELSAWVVTDLKSWMQAERGILWRHSQVGKAMEYSKRCATNSCSRLSDILCK